MYACVVELFHTSFKTEHRYRYEVDKFHITISHVSDKMMMYYFYLSYLYENITLMEKINFLSDNLLFLCFYSLTQILMNKDEEHISF